MRHYWISRLTLLLVFAFSLSIDARRANADDKTSPVDLLDEQLQARVRKNGFSGAVLVAKDGRSLFAKGYGLANAEHGVPNTPATKFRIGSVSKPIAALILLMLFQEGKLKLDDPVRKYVPDAPEAWDKITLHHLLSHTAGVPEHTNQPGFKKQMATPTSPADIIRSAAAKPMDFQPGEKFKYSNTGYILLGMVAEKVTGQPYARLVQEKIFQPLGMKSSGYDEPGAILPGRASGYSRRGDKLVQAEYIHMSWPFAAGALYSTVEDLLRLDEALYGDKLLGSELRKKMFTPVLKSYAYGWTVSSRLGHKTIEHGGAIPGFRSSFIHLPDDHVFIAILCNVEPAPIPEVAGDLLAFALKEGGKPMRK